ncbi:NADPH-dependent ferric siderophore reductase [Nocardiopsis terrae]|uniref:NADPH-dependent ferric siderophore reductase n=1 Tax=Nocardiopsis terrae TaxID=372655 RepID=A0ABR9HHV6_9ACTN|nr:siderophore-interacting protein [Nocardiopsis terrae]MBE1458614.1 NADPH-dependent ferric siderophore reductase [Nocardiopsis terrae]
MTERQARPKRTVHTGRVESVEQLTPHMIRVVLGGEGLSEFATGGAADSYVKLLFPPPGPNDPESFDLDAVRAERPRSEWPVTRTYTVRSWDPGTRELTIDFVHHGEVGLAGVWAAGAEPGDRLRLLGPGGGYAPDPEADWHLLAGDETALPAIAAALEQLPEGRPAHVFVEVEDAREEQPLAAAEGVRVHWLHRDGGVPGARLVPAVRALEFPSGDVQAFVHGEAGFVRDLRRLLRVELALPKERLSVSGYWRLGRDEDGWQASKAEWNRSVEAEEAAALHS